MELSDFQKNLPQTITDTLKVTLSVAGVIQLKEDGTQGFRIGYDTQDASGEILKMYEEFLPSNYDIELSVSPDNENPNHLNVTMTATNRTFEG